MAILDTYTGAYAAYSVRKVRDAYSGSAIRIRRSSDSTEQDIGFDGSGNLDTAAIASFCGAGSGYVKTIYDQVGSNNITQATAGRQPIVYSSGTQVTDGGLPAITFDGTDDYLRVTLGAAVSQPFSLFHVRRYNANTGTKLAFGFGVEDNRYADINIFNTFRTYFGSYLGTFTENTTRQLWTACINGASSAVGLNNGTLTTGNAGAATLTHLSLGAAANSAGTTVFFPAPINFQEALIYNSDQQSNRSGIYTAINQYYGLVKSITISTPVAGSGMVDETTRGGLQSQNEISLTGTSSGFTGAIEASFNGGAYATIDTIAVSGDSWTGTISNVAAGRGTITVREVADTGNSGTVANFGVGYCFILTGDSNAVGQLTNNQTHGLGSNVPYIYEGSWVAFNTATNFWIKFAQLLTTETGKPCTFVRHATGSQDMALRGTTAQQSYNSAGSNFAALVARVAASGITSFNACLCSFGPNAAGVTGPVLTADEYEAAIKSFRDALRTSIGQSNLPVYLGVFGKSSVTTAGNPTVRNGIAQAIRKGIIQPGPNVIEQDWSDGVHPKTDAEGATMSARWWLAFRGYRSPRVVTIRRVDAGILSVGVDRVLLAGPIDYTEACFTLDDGTVVEATREGDKELRFAHNGSPTLIRAIFPSETAIGATIPTGETVVLPATIHGVSSAVQPIDPIAGLPIRYSSSKPAQVLDSVFKPIFKTVFSKVME